jgi:hypothetical protein
MKKRHWLWIWIGSALLVIVIAVSASGTPNNKVNTSQTASKTSTSSTTKKPVITTKSTTTTSSIPYTTSTVDDSSLASGTTKVQTQGVNGLQTTTWLTTYSNGVETSKKQVSVVTTTAPINEVIDQGTYVAPTPTPPPTGCHPLSNENTCYEPGEYCRTSDYGTSGVAGDGEAITCEDNNGWRWEPS